MNKKENFINSLSINRYLNNDLKSLDLEECLDLFNTLRSQCFLIDENNLYFDCIDFETVEYYLQKLFSIESFYDFSKVYIECLLQGENILERSERKRTLRIRQCRLSGTNLLWLARVLSICSTRNRNVSCTIIRRNKRTTILNAN